MVTPLRMLLLADTERWLPETAEALATLGYTTTWERVDEEQRCRTLLDLGDWDVVLCSFDGAHPQPADRRRRPARNAVNSRERIGRKSDR